MKAALFLFVMLSALTVAQEVSVEDHKLPPLPDLTVEEGGDEYPPLPAWSTEEKAKAERNELEPNFSLLDEFNLADDAQIYIPDEAEAALQDAAAAEVVISRDLSPELIAKYFDTRPDAFMKDPQGFLTQQEFLDRVAFLDYHAADSKIPIYLLVFDGEQIVPEGKDAETVLSQHFSAEENAVLIYYFLNEPTRSQIAVSKNLKTFVTETERIKIAQSCMDEAIARTDTISQLERFSVELSIRLFWLEKRMNGTSENEESSKTPVVAQNPVVSAAPVSLMKKSEQMTLMLESPELRNSLIALLTLLTAGVVAYTVRRKKLQAATFELPEIEVKPRLGAAHAAGIGAVISFSNHAIPPSQQKEDGNMVS